MSRYDTHGTKLLQHDYACTSVDNPPAASDQEIACGWDSRFAPHVPRLFHNLLAQEYRHGGYPANRYVRYGSHNMADAQGAKNRHVYFSIKTAFNKMI